MRTRRTPAFQMIVGASLLLAACREAPLDAGRRAEEPSWETSGELTARARFAPVLHVGGALRPGEPILIRYDVEALTSTPDVRIQIVLPEANPGAAVEPQPWIVRQWRGAMPAGRRVAGRVGVTIPEPGLYRVVLSARAMQSSPAGPRQPRYVDTDVSTLWIDVRPGGGRVFSEREAERDPMFQRIVPGPAQLRPRFTDDHVPVEEGGGSGGGTGTATVTRRFSIMYFDPDLGRLRGIPGVKVRHGPALNVTRADDSGLVTLPCPVLAQVTLETDQAVMSGVQWFSDTCDAPQAPGASTVIQYSGSAAAAHLLSNVTRAARRAEAFFGRSRSQVNVVVNPQTARAWYDRTDDRIVIGTAAGTGNVWGVWGAFLAGHEYGHAYHERALGGLADENPENCAEHDFTSDEHPICAWQEGLANYLAVAVHPDDSVASYHPTMLQGQWYAAARSSGLTDGSRIEGAVATFLLHVGGTPDAPAAAPAPGGPYLANLIHGCHSQFQGLFYEQASSVEGIVYCMEKQVDPWVRASFFLTGFDVSGQSSATARPASFTMNHVRRLWMLHLYHQTWSF